MHIILLLPQDRAVGVGIDLNITLIYESTYIAYTWYIYLKCDKKL